MAPVVHGLEQLYRGRIDFLYLNIDDPRNDSAKRAFGFRATPHFFFAPRSASFAIQCKASFRETASDQH